MCSIIFSKKNYHRLKHKTVEVARVKERHFTTIII